MQRTIPALFEESVSCFAENRFLWEKKEDMYEALTYSQSRERVHFFAAGLLKHGIRKGDRIALISEGRSDWIISELGILYAGAVAVPLSVKLESPDLKFRLAHSSSRIVIASRFQAEKILQIKNCLTGLELIIYLDNKENYEYNETGIEDIIKSGRDFLSEQPGIVSQMWQSVQENDYANICYTSGTTAEPKGIILSHLNYFANVNQAISLMDIPEWYRTLLILPLDHAFAHTAGIYCFMKMGAGIGMVKTGKTPAETIRNISVNIKEFGPNILLSVPALAKNFRKNIEKAIKEKGRMIEKLFNHALKISYRYNAEGWNRGKGFNIFYKPLIRLYDKVIFNKIRKNLGGKLVFFIGGGALLDIELQRFFYALRIPIFQGYGLTEAAPVISSNAPHKHKLGSSGFIAKGIEIKICDDKGNGLPAGVKGEIVIKGENVMCGYWNNPAATAEVIRNGWLYTGDMGYLDNEGFLYVLGRFKSLLIGNDGEKYNPEGIEEALTEHSRYISQVMLHNNQDPYTIALIVPDKEALKHWLSENNYSADAPDGQKAALNLIKKEIDQFRAGGKFAGIFPERWLPAAIGILEQGFTEQNHLMNSTLKIVRGNITVHYKELIEYLYSPEAKDICSRYNKTAIEAIFTK